MENRLYSNQWKENTAKSAEGVILLDLVKIIQIKSHHIDSDYMILTINCRELYRMINGNMVTPNKHMQDAVAKAAMINQVLDQIKFKIQIQLQRGHK